MGMPCSPGHRAKAARWALGTLHEAAQGYGCGARELGRPEALGLVSPGTPELLTGLGSDTVCLLIEQVNMYINIQGLKPRG